MKLVIIEPLGVEKERLLSMAEEALKGRAEIIYYDTRATDTQELIRRGQDADVIVVSNLPLNGEVIRGCRNLKLLSVAFTGVDHIDMEPVKNRGNGVQLRRLFYLCGGGSRLWPAYRPCTAI